ncbi:MAG: xanthine dehydrogenase accessory factor [Myxococcales bacterium]|nr:xanthine dehydrogenase accessory factor [Myxococcales bacterium]
MSELDVIVREAAALRREGSPFLLATVVAVRGSSYRRPGARMIVALDVPTRGDEPTRGGDPTRGDRWVAGCVSGGCLEGDVVRRGAHRIRHGAPVVVTYDSTSDDEIGWGFGLGCNGVVEVMLEQIDQATAVDPLLFANECIAAETRGVLVTVFRTTDDAVRVGARLALRPAAPTQTSLPDGPVRAALEAAARAAVTTSTVEVRGVTALVEVLEPPPRLFVCGTGHDALPVVALARSMGWRVTVAAAHPSVATRDRFVGADELLPGPGSVLRDAAARHARSFAVVMSHDYDRDRDCVAALLESRVEYIGVLGPKRRTERMLAELAQSGTSVTDAMLSRLHAPVGLDLGAETPQEIALAVISEVQATLTDAPARRLRERSGPIHVPAAVQRRGDVVCVVLGAGASTRLGRPKQLEAFAGKPLVRHVVDEVASSSCAAVAVVVGANAERITPVLDGARATVLDNAAWSEGIASSIREAASWAERSGAAALVIVLADQPLLDRVHVDRLVDAWRTGAAAAGSVYGGALGVPAVFDASLFGELRALEGDRGAAKILRGHEGVLSVDWPEGAVDVDTAADADALATLARRDPALCSC